MCHQKLSLSGCPVFHPTQQSSLSASSDAIPEPENEDEEKPEINLNKTALVVDDNKMNQLILKRMLVIINCLFSYFSSSFTNTF